MQLVIVRHGVAEEGDWMRRHGKGDDERPLTAKGASEMHAVAQGLAALGLKPQQILASPLVRAQQTAAILAAHLSMVEPETLDELRSETAPSETLQAIARAVNSESVIVVGHQPNLSALATLMVTGETLGRINIGRGCSCGLRFQSRIAPGSAFIEFLVPRHIFREQRGEEDC